MNHIAIRSKDEMYIYEEKDLNHELLTMLFINNPYKVIYVTKEKALYGGITLGDFVRYLKGNRDLIQTRMTFLYEDTKEKAHEILDQPGGKIRCVPIVNSQNEIVYEYYRTDMLLNSVDIEFVKKYQSSKKDTKLTNLLQMHGFKNAILINETDYNKDIYSIVLELLQDSKLSFVEMSFSELTKKRASITFDDTIILDVDSVYNRSYLKGLYYRKYKLQYINYGKIVFFLDNTTYGDFEDNYKSSVNLLGSIYGDIIICGINSIALSIYERLVHRKNNLVHLSNHDDLVWNDKEQCYHFVNAPFVPELIISCDFMIHQSYVLFDQSKILHMPIQAFYSEALGNSDFCDFDIAYNIIPKLTANGVIPIVIDSPNQGLSMIENKEALRNIKDRGFLWDVSVGKIDVENLDAQSKKELKKFMTYEDYIEVLQEHNNLPLSMRRGYPEIENFNGDFYNVYNNKRLTVGSSRNNDKNKVRMFGACITFGIVVKDEDTIASRLQMLLDGEFCVENYGNFYMSQCFKMRLCDYKPGDIVIIIVLNSSHHYKERGINTHSIINAYNRIPALEENIWDTLLHINRNLSPYIAEELNAIINEYKQKLSLEDRNTVEGFTFKNENIIGSNSISAIEEWLRSIKRFEDTKDKRIGSIVMNCNPFTYGHKYLIQTAIEKVEYLYIFVVEENKSFFSFEDRIAMVRLGVEDLNQNNNIKVLPSGSFIISSTTMPGYFEKDQLQEVIVDMTDDVEIFAKHIAPYLNITIRFAGEEPLDKFTNQYNDTMREILPRNGIEFFVIGRKELDGEPISASRVRKKLKVKDFESIKRMVPITTYKYLKRNYNYH